MAKRETLSAEQRRAHVGRTVTWPSGGGDVRNTNMARYGRTGVIVAYVPAGESMSSALGRPPSYDGLPDGLDVSAADRYVMRVDRAGAKGKPLPPKRYAPHAGIIDAAIAAEEAKK